MEYGRDKIVVWVNCYYCAEYIWFNDYCRKCKMYHCVECQCNVKGYEQYYHGYDADLGQYDNDKYYAKHVKYYSLC